MTGSQAIITSDREPATVTEHLSSTTIKATPKVVKPPAKPPLKMVKPPATTISVKPEPKQGPEPQPELKVEKPDIEPLKELKQEIDIGTKEEQTPEKKTVSFKSHDFLKNEVKKQTAKAPEAEKESAEPKETVESVQAKIKEVDNDTSEQFSLEDFELFAEIIIDVVTVFMTTALRWYAKDDSDAAYEIPVKKQKMLVKQLARLLVKYQAKFSLEFMFILTLVLVYATPFNKARTHRKAVVAKEKGIEAENVEYVEVKDSDTKTPDKKKVVKPPRKKGGQPK